MYKIFLSMVKKRLGGVRRGSERFEAMESMVSVVDVGGEGSHNDDKDSVEVLGD